MYVPLNILIGFIIRDIFGCLDEFNRTKLNLRRSNGVARRLNLTLIGVDKDLILTFIGEKLDSTLHEDFYSTTIVRDKFEEIDNHLYGGDINIYNNGSQLNSACHNSILEKIGSEIFTIFYANGIQYTIEPLVSGTSTNQGNHSLKIGAINSKYHQLFLIENSINASRQFKKRDKGVNLIIETTIHIPQTKITTPERYLLHIIAQTNEIFKYPILNLDLKIKVADVLTYLDKDIIPFDIVRTFNKFADYKKEYLPNIDLSILISDHVLEPSSIGITTGITGLAFMCLPSVSVLVVQDEGMMTAQGIAHEIGHMLGAHHDMNSACNGSDKRGIMHYGSTGIQKNRWSTCSNNEIYGFLSTYQADCLRSTSLLNGLKDTYLDISGYDLHNMQCSINLNYSDSRTDYAKSNCKSFYCLKRNASFLMSTSPLEGTPCLLKNNRTQLTPIKYGRLCYRGVCKTQEEISGTVPIIWGNWSPWSDWSVCLYLGFRIRYRTCISNEPRKCTGDKAMAERCRRL